MTEPAREHVVHRTLTQAQFDRFADLSGDHNPIHVDPDTAARMPFGATVAHGMLLYLILDGIARSLLPGATAVTQHLTFPAPTFADIPLAFRAHINSVEDNIAHVSLHCQQQHDNVVTCTGICVYQLQQDVA